MPDVDVGLTENTRAQRSGAAMIDTALRKRFELMVAKFQRELATVAILAFAAPSFAAEPAKTVGQAPPSFYLVQDSATMKCQIVEAQPAAGGTIKVVGAAHSTNASADTALKADKTCK